MSQLKRTFEDGIGKVVVQDARKTFNGINSDVLVEMNGEGYVIAFFKYSKDNTIEIDPVGGRLVEENIGSDTMMEALKYGYDLAEILLRADDE